MLTKEEAINVLKKELPYLKTAFGVKRIGLFGSYSRGIQKEDSDVDIIVEFEKPIGLKFVELADYIENILDRKVDIHTRRHQEHKSKRSSGKYRKEYCLCLNSNALLLHCSSACKV